MSSCFNMFVSRYIPPNANNSYIYIPKFQKGVRMISSNPKKKHVLLCEDHKHDAENVNLFEKYRKENILS